MSHQTLRPHRDLDICVFQVRLGGETMQFHYSYTVTNIWPLIKLYLASVIDA